MERTFLRISLAMMSLLIIAIVMTTLRYFGSDSSNYFQPDIYLDRLIVLRVHIAAGIVAALAGPLQFVPAVRNKFPATHRTLGRIYISAVLTGAIFSIMIATTAVGGAISQAGFSTMAILWAASALMALHKIRNGNIAEHKKWMIRSFAITFGFVTLRIIFPTLQLGVGLDQTIAYQIAAWLCWIPNLLVVEYAMRTKHQPDSDSL